MKKIVSTLLLLSCVLTLTSLGYTTNARVAIGSRSEEVKAIQEILKTDPDIYPEGYVTGYYGSLTEKAIKKLQKRCGLPETGELDDATEKCIYPVGRTFVVVYPNGGEGLDRNQIYTIKWEMISATGQPVTPETYPFWPKASIDLFRRVAPTCLLPEGCPTETKTSVFIRHIATVNLFDLNYSWKITSDIPNGSDYVIRISTGRNIVPMWIQEKEAAPGASISVRPTEIWPVPPSPTNFWDESNGTFTISGEVQPCVCPTCPTYQNLSEVIKILENIAAELQKAITLLKGMSQ
jgi:peptidoglycan hydrolase-like protein with peptidoglycan-binding domain